MYCKLLHIYLVLFASDDDGEKHSNKRKKPSTNADTSISFDTKNDNRSLSGELYYYGCISVLDTLDELSHNNINSILKYVQINSLFYFFMPGSFPGYCFFFSN